MIGHHGSQSRHGYNMIRGVNVSGIGDIELSRNKRQDERNKNDDGSSVEYEDWYDDDTFDEIYFENDEHLENEMLMGHRRLHNYDSDIYKNGKKCGIKLILFRSITFVLLLMLSFLGLYLWTQKHNDQNSIFLQTRDDVKNNHDIVQQHDNYIHNDTYDPFDINSEHSDNDDFFIATNYSFGAISQSNEQEEIGEILASHTGNKYQIPKVIANQEASKTSSTTISNISNSNDNNKHFNSTTTVEDNHAPIMKDHNSENNRNSPLYSEKIISSSFADVTEPYDIKGADLPIYWHIPKSGGTAVEDILGNCFGLAEASQQGIMNGHEGDKDLKLSRDPDGIIYANVDVSTPDGIKHAQSMGLIDDTLIVDVAVTSYINEIAEIMKPQSNRGRCFTLIRHPIERAVSMFYYLQIASWETTYHPKWKNMTIEQYAQSEFVENNWMTRMLIQRLSGGGPITPDEFELAKDILRNKCLIGLLEDLDNSLIRFESYFHWNRDENINKVQFEDSKSLSKLDQLSCQKNVLKRGGDNAHPHPHYSEDSDVWNELSKNVFYDLQLYEYALELYEEQRKLIL